MAGVWGHASVDHGGRLGIPGERVDRGGYWACQPFWFPLLCAAACTRGLSRACAVGLKALRIRLMWCRMRRVSGRQPAARVGCQSSEGHLALRHPPRWMHDPREQHVPEA